MFISAVIILSLSAAQLSALGLERELLSAHGRHNDAVKRIERAVTLQDTLKYTELQTGTIRRRTEVEQDFERAWKYADVTLKASVF